MSLFSILSLASTHDDDKQQYKKKRKPGEGNFYIHTTRQKWFQDDDRVIAAAYVLVKYTYDAIYTMQKKKRKRRDTMP